MIRECVEYEKPKQEAFGCMYANLETSEIDIDKYILYLQEENDGSLPAATDELYDYLFRVRRYKGGTELDEVMQQFFAGEFVSVPQAYYDVLEEERQAQLDKLREQEQLIYEQE